jgi:hypothetical protein
VYDEWALCPEETSSRILGVSNPFAFSRHSS